MYGQSGELPFIDSAPLFMIGLTSRGRCFQFKLGYDRQLVYAVTSTEQSK